MSDMSEYTDGTAALERARYHLKEAVKETAKHARPRTTVLELHEQALELIRRFDQEIEHRVRSMD